MFHRQGTCEALPQCIQYKLFSTKWQMKQSSPRQYVINLAIHATLIILESVISHCLPSLDINFAHKLQCDPALQSKSQEQIGHRLKKLRHDVRFKGVGHCAMVICFPLLSSMALIV